MSKTLDLEGQNWVSGIDETGTPFVRPGGSGFTYYCAADMEDAEDIDLRAAALMSAAPELYLACKEFIRKVESGEASSVRSYAQMKAAVEKAEAPL